MQQTPFHAYYTARMLSGLSGDPSLIPAFASSNIGVYPYQIAAAGFALRSPYLKGCILGDEGSLGKTYETLLIASQMWYEGRSRQLIVLPVNMVDQWAKKMESSFSIPYVVVDNTETFDNIKDENPFEQDAIIVTTYDFAVEKAEQIKQQPWDLIVFDEADRLNKVYDENAKRARVLKELSDGSFKLLLTPTPITKDIRDIYGLIYFIDETVLPYDIDTFYNTYFRQPEKYPELAAWVSKFCFRTLKSQVSGYVNFTRRIPYTVACDFTKDEQLLYEKMNAYIMRPQKNAYPNMSSRDLHNMTIKWNHILSSSPQAITETIAGAVDRLKRAEVSETKKGLFAEEIKHLDDLWILAKSIDINGKMKVLLPILKKGFARLRQLRHQQKAIIFTDNHSTLKRLTDLLSEAGYNLLTYSGNNSRDYTIMERFRNDKDIRLLIATDDMAKGLDIEFCPIVINYDMLSNAPLLEQRINRCHRQGQKSDVLVINLFNKNNYADTRYLELINKRILQFDGIFGMSDALLGNFDAEIEEVLGRLRPAKDIQDGFDSNLTEHEPQNRHLVANSEDMLFTTFTKEIADKVTVTPKYISEKIDKIQDDLWEVSKWFFKQYNEYAPDPDDFITQFMKVTKHTCHYEIDEKERTITAHPCEKGLPTLFYYWSGNGNKRYVSLKSYGMSKDFKPHYGRITLSSVFGREVINEIKCNESGTLVVDDTIEPCTIGFYCVEIRSKGKGIYKGKLYQEYNVFAGKTDSGKILSDEECKRIMELPVIQYSESAILPKEEREIGELVRIDKLIERYIKERNSVQTEEIERIKLRASKDKAALEHELEDIRAQIATTEKEADTITLRIKRMEIDRKLSCLYNELKQKEEDLFIDSMQTDIDLEKQIHEFLEKEKPTANIERKFVLKVEGIN